MASADSDEDNNHHRWGLGRHRAGMSNTDCTYATGTMEPLTYSRNSNIQPLCATYDFTLSQCWPQGTNPPQFMRTQERSTKKVVGTQHPAQRYHQSFSRPKRKEATIGGRHFWTRQRLFLYALSVISALLSPSVLSQSEAVPGQPYPTTANKNSGQFTRRVEGASLTSTSVDTDTNCTITFRTRSAQQHFVIRFEELKLGCHDHLILFDGDMDYGQPSIKDFSCRDNMASVPIIKTTGTFLTIRFSSDSSSKSGDGFRLVVTAVFDISMSDCPPEYAFCRSHLCISRSLFCDGINHCLDNSDEVGCNGPDDTIELPYALGFFIILVLVISVGVVICIVSLQHPYEM